MLQKPLCFNYAEGISQEISPTVDSVAFGQIILNGISGVGINANGQSITGLPSPVNPSDASNKAYVDAVAQGLDLKGHCQALAVTNITSMAGTMTVDGYALAVGDRILLTAQTTASQNGIWRVQTGAWVRPTDFYTGNHAASVFTYIEEGTNYADQGWVCVTDHPNDVIDTNNLAWTQFTGAGQITAGSGLKKDGNTLSVLLDTNSGLQFVSGALTHFLTASGGLQTTSAGLGVLLQAAGTATATLQSTSGGLGVLGLPNLFTVAGTPTTGNVSAANLNTLTAGTASIADGLHQHQNVLSARVVADTHTTSTAVSPGDPVAWSATASVLARGDASVDANARIIGLAAAAIGASGAGSIIKRGVAKGVLAGATPGMPYYLNVGGGLTPTQPTGSALRLVRMGWAVSTTDLEVSIYDMGKRSV